MEQGFVAINMGFPGSCDKVLEATAAMGKVPRDLRAIVLTHCHVDHMGSAAALQRAAGAAVYAHEADAPIIQSGQGFQPVQAAPGLHNRIMFTLLSLRPPKVEPVPASSLTHPGKASPFCADLTANPRPWSFSRPGGAALAAARRGAVRGGCVRHRRGMTVALAHEGLAVTRKSLAMLAGLTFDVAWFGHGKPIMAGADQEFRRTWLPAEARGRAKTWRRPGTW